MEQVRSFIAIELPDELKTGLSQLQVRLKAGNRPWVKWVNPFSIHLTLKFLGNVAADKINEITGAMEEATLGIPPFLLELKDLGVFPDPRRVQVVWVGIRGEVEKLAQLQQRIEFNLAHLGFAPESRPFTPHLTLARIRPQVSPDERQSFGKLVVGTEYETAGNIKVVSISLMESQLTREGAIYSRIGSVRLKKPLSTTAA